MSKVMKLKVTDDLPARDVAREHLYSAMEKLWDVYALVDQLAEHLRANDDDGLTGAEVHQAGRVADVCRRMLKQHINEMDDFTVKGAA